MNFAQYNRIAIPEGNVKQITRKSDGLLLWKSKYINQVPISINADGTIYNDGLGYKEGYRVRSGGAEATSDNAVCTGFIPYKKGDILMLYPKYAKTNALNAINFADADFNNLGQITGENTRYGICNADSYGTQWRALMTNMNAQTGNITTLDISSIDNAGDIAYVRITVPLSYNIDYAISSGSEIIVTVNEEITL